MSQTAPPPPAGAGHPAGQAEISVRFERSYRSWNRGVVAGFSAAMAEALIKRGIAVRFLPAAGREPLGGRKVEKA